MSTLDEEDFAVKWSVSNGTLTGTILATNGLAIQAGSTINATVTGSIYGHQVNLAGSNYTINYPGGPGSAARHQVELLR